MQMLSEIIEHIVHSRTGMRNRRNLILCLAAVVVFITTYMLILPAITIDNSSAKRIPGINAASNVKTEADEEASSDAGKDSKSESGIENGSKAVASVKDSTSQSGDNGSSGKDEPGLGVSENKDGDEPGGSESADAVDTKEEAGKKAGKAAQSAKAADAKAADSDSRSADDELELLTEETPSRIGAFSYLILSRHVWFTVYGKALERWCRAGFGFESQ